MDHNTRHSGLIRRCWRRTRQLARRFHDDEAGIAATEYIIVFSLITFGATLAVLSTAMFVKGYRDFLVWWFAHPAV